VGLNLANTASQQQDNAFDFRSEFDNRNLPNRAQLDQAERDSAAGTGRLWETSGRGSDD